MPHLSDGDLHEWLDGELSASSVEEESVRLHIETCPDCAARLEAARELREETEEVLASAVPREIAPSFEQIRARAFVDTIGAEGTIESRRTRRPWLSVQRLGWAATVVLAVGAGWIGRAVLEEKGWTDPFHEGLPAEGRVVDSETDADVPLEYFAREQEALEEAAGEPETSNEARGDRGAVVQDEHTPSAPEAAAPKSTGALAKAGQPRAEDTAGAPPMEVAPVDELADALPEADRQAARAKSLRPALDPWHTLPEPRLSGPGVDVAGCYRLEYSWSPGVADLPGTLELLSEESEGREGQSVFAVLSGIGRTTLHEAVWASPSRDSVWVRLVSGKDRDTFTVRAGRSGPDWVGEGRVLRPGGPVSVGQTRGAVDLVRIGCEPS